MTSGRDGTHVPRYASCRTDALLVVLIHEEGSPATITQVVLLAMAAVVAYWGVRVLLARSRR